ncbi:uncharacterized protein G2W53_022517 [Senna tora]|uniref:Uncharacterized protein n=1 Tax=Senna tora TaxID=362788 RepID=A0A834WKK5_9FABA|nr:uncharacterized protein G2W53_022517 [Senna tora]
MRSGPSLTNLAKDTIGVERGLASCILALKGTEVVAGVVEIGTETDSDEAPEVVLDIGECCVPEIEELEALETALVLEQSF